MKKLNAPKGFKYIDGILSWDTVPGAAGYIIYDGDEIIGITADTTFSAPVIKTALQVRAVNKYGSQGKLGTL